MIIIQMQDVLLYIMYLLALMNERTQGTYFTCDIFLHLVYSLYLLAFLYLLACLYLLAFCH